MATFILELIDHCTHCDDYFCLFRYARSHWAQSKPCASEASNYGNLNLAYDSAADYLGDWHVFFYSTMGNFMENTLGLDKNFVGYVKVVLAHAVLGIPFVIITVTATLVGFDTSLTRAAANMGANPITTFSASKCH